MVESADSPKKRSINPWSYSVINWKLPPERLNEQLAYYNGLKIYQSTRGVAVIVMVGIVVLTVILASISGVEDWSSIMWPIIIYGILAIFIYRGSRVAIILTMLLWSFDKISRLAAGESFLYLLIYWITVMATLYPALQIENARRKKLINN